MDLQSFIKCVPKHLEDIMQRCLAYTSASVPRTDPPTQLSILYNLSIMIGTPELQMEAMCCFGILWQQIGSLPSEPYSLLIKSLQSNARELLVLLTRIIENTSDIVYQDDQTKNEFFAGLEDLPREMFDLCLPQMILLQLRALRAAHITPYAKYRIIRFLDHINMKGAAESFAKELVDTFAQIATELPEFDAEDKEDYVTVIQKLMRQISKLAAGKHLINATFIDLNPNTSVIYRTNVLLMLKSASFKDRNDDVRKQALRLLNDKERIVRLQAINLCAKMKFEHLKDKIMEQFAKDGEALCSDTEATLGELITYLDAARWILMDTTSNQEIYHIPAHTLDIVIRSFRLSTNQMLVVWDTISVLRELPHNHLDLNLPRLTVLLEICETTDCNPYTRVGILMALWGVSCLPSFKSYREKWTLSLETIIREANVPHDVRVACYAHKALISVRWDEDPTPALNSFFGAGDNALPKVAEVKLEGLRRLHLVNSLALWRYHEQTLLALDQCTEDDRIYCEEFKWRLASLAEVRPLWDEFLSAVADLFKTTYDNEPL